MTQFLTVPPKNLYELGVIFQIRESLNHNKWKNYLTSQGSLSQVPSDRCSADRLSLVIQKIVAPCLQKNVSDLPKREIAALYWISSGLSNFESDQMISIRQRIHKLLNRSSILSIVEFKSDLNRLGNLLPNFRITTAPESFVDFISLLQLYQFMRKKQYDIDHNLILTSKEVHGGDYGRCQIIQTHLEDLLSKYFRQREFSADGEELMRKITLLIGRIFKDMYTSDIRALLTNNRILSKKCRTEFVTLQERKEDVSDPLDRFKGVNLSIFIHTYAPMNDQVVVLCCRRALIDRTPVLLTTELFIQLLTVFPELTTSRDWKYYIHKAKHLILCLPLKFSGSLSSRGYNPDVFHQPTSHALQIIENLPLKVGDFAVDSDTFAKSLSSIFYDSPNIPKRIYFFGHGAASTSIARDDGVIAGLRLPQMREIISKWDENGMDCATFSSCSTGGRNLIRLFHGRKLNCVICICSLVDHPVSLLSTKYKIKSYIRVRDFYLFWRTLNHALKQKKIVHLNLEEPLKYIYGGHLTGIPLVKTPSSKGFHVVNIGRQVGILTQKKLYEMKFDPTNRLLLLSSVKALDGVKMTIQKRIDWCSRNLLTTIRAINCYTADPLISQIAALYFHYSQLKKLYSSLKIQESFFDRIVIQKIAEHETQLVDIEQFNKLPGFIAFSSHRVLKTHQLMYNQELLLVYPSVVKPTIQLWRSKKKGTLPRMISMIPDHAAFIFDHIISQETSFREFINEFLFSSINFDEKLQVHQRAIVIKRLELKEGVVEGVVAYFDKKKNKPIIIFREERRYYIHHRNRGFPISLEEFVIRIYQLIKDTVPQKRAVDFVSQEFPFFQDEYFDFRKEIFNFFPELMEGNLFTSLILMTAQESSSQIKTAEKLSKEELTFVLIHALKQSNCQLVDILTKSGIEYYLDLENSDGDSVQKLMC